ncbi:putative cytochrome P450 monooxygenase [Mollisia scopiformis]|uniref:Putative cytochrome P450 monooxygenase n=1 Tax=Mollisia scopiformis TaxID=149040 RepID=A0A194XN90_MOLSC|nr:putative cytochrome P450 monooxygenase [Mollisia scopiformis]KUJ21564.1 putative cytochrome P450 monooxygenase [Mollisia scopiformis]
MSSYLILTLTALVIFLGTFSVYRLYLHPNSKFPGPKLWAISRVPMAYNLARGRLPYRIAELHDKYGPVVRVAPNDLSFITAEAWNDIYGKPVGRPQLAKDPVAFLRNPNDYADLLFEPDPTEHGRMRRNFSHAFSEKSLRDQEPIIGSNIEKMVTRIREVCKDPIDITAWLNYVTFDIIGDLTFGDNFQCLDSGNLHPWVSNLFTWVATIGVLGMFQSVLPVAHLLLRMAPKSMRDSEKYHRAMTKERLDKRLANPNPRPDFMSAVQRFVDRPYGLTYMEVFQTCSIFMVGGSETTATTLTGMVYYILRTPRVYNLLVEELRSTFKDSSEINMANSGKLNYTIAVVNEGMRILHPLPGNLRRVTPPEGWVVAGWKVPGNTLVAVDSYAAYHSRSNFHNPKEFVPERWMSDPPAPYKNDKLKVLQPFSVGPRNCIGKNLALMEMRLILAKIFFNFDVEIMPESVGYVEGLKVYTFIKRPPFMIKMTPVAV